MSQHRLPKSVMLLSSGPPISLKVLYCLNRLGIATDIIDLGSPGIARHSRYRRGYRQLGLSEDGNIMTVEEIGDALQAHARAAGIDGLIGGDIRSSGVVHAIGDRLPGMTIFPSSDMATLDMLDDKWKFSQFMAGNSIPGPRTILLEDIADLDEPASTLDFPLVVKPLFGESGHGVACIRDIEGLRKHLASGSKYARLPLLIQAFVPGYDADISVLASNGRVVCHVLHARSDNCTLRFMENEEAVRVASRIVEAAGYTGVANIDLRINKDTGAVTVLECNPRFWYTLQASLWRGLNFVEAGFRLALGEDMSIQSPADGTYHLHGCLMTRIIWNPARWRDIKGYNLCGLMQALSDPLPFIRGRT